MLVALLCHFNSLCFYINHFCSSEARLALLCSACFPVSNRIVKKNDIKKKTFNRFCIAIAACKVGVFLFSSFGSAVDQRSYHIQHDLKQYGQTLHRREVMYCEFYAGIKSLHPWLTNCVSEWVSNWVNDKTSS